MAKWTVLPTFEDGQRVPMWSADFAKWWLVCRLTDITNVVFMNKFKGSVLANWYLNLLVSLLDFALVAYNQEQQWQLACQYHAADGCI